MLSDHHARPAGHKFRLFATALAVMLGVAFMAGTLVLTDTFGQTFDDLFADVYKGTDAVVRAKAAFDRAAGHRRAAPVRRRVARRHAAAGCPGVAAAEGSVYGYARLIGKDGKALGNPANGAPTLGRQLDQVASAQPAGTSLAGHAPQGPAEVVIDQKSADRRPPRASVTPPPSWSWDRRSGSRSSGIVALRQRRQPGRRVRGAVHHRRSAQQLVAAPGKFDQHLLRRRAGRLAAAAGRQPPAGVCRTASRRHRRDVTKETQNQLRQGPGVLQHLPADLRRGRAARRRVHDLQHLLHHRRAAHPGERPAARARREPPAGARLGARSRRWSSASSRRCSGWRPGSPWPSG